MKIIVSFLLCLTFGVNLAWSQPVVCQFDGGLSSDLKIKNYLEIGVMPITIAEFDIGVYADIYQSSFDFFTPTTIETQTDAYHQYSLGALASTNAYGLCQVQFGISFADYSHSDSVSKIDYSGLGIQAAMIYVPGNSFVRRVRGKCTQMLSSSVDALDVTGRDVDVRPYEDFYHISLSSDFNLLKIYEKNDVQWNIALCTEAFISSHARGGNVALGVLGNPSSTPEVGSYGIVFRLHHWSGLSTPIPSVEMNIDVYFLEL